MSIVTPESVLAICFWEATARRSSCTICIWFQKWWPILKVSQGISPPLRLNYTEKPEVYWYKPVKLEMTPCYSPIVFMDLRRNAVNKVIGGIVVDAELKCIILTVYGRELRCKPSIYGLIASSIFLLFILHVYEKFRLLIFLPSHLKMCINLRDEVQSFGEILSWILSWIHSR